MNKELYTYLAENVSFSRCEEPSKCTLKMEGKRAENVPFLVFLSSVITQFLTLFFSFNHLIKSN